MNYMDLEKQSVSGSIASYSYLVILWIYSY